MNTYAWVLLAAAAVAAVANWVAVARRTRSGEQLARPIVVALLIAVAVLLHADASEPGRWLLAALGLSLLGDLLLPWRSDRAFGWGLLAFLLARIAVVGAIITMPRAGPIWEGVTVAVLVTVGLVWVVLWPLVRRDLGEGWPPTAYALVNGAFVAVAWWSGNLLVAVGATLFFVSDAVLATRRLWRDLPGSGVVVMVTYYVAQVALLFGVLRPDVVLL